MVSRQAALFMLAIVLVASCQQATRAPEAASSSPAGSDRSVGSAASSEPSPSRQAVTTSAPTVRPAPTPSPTPGTTPGVPPPPAAVKITMKGSDPGGAGYDTRITTTITWKEAPAKGTDIRIFGVTKCLPPPGQDPAPCLVEHTPLPDSVLYLIAKAPASNGRVSWTWPAWDDIGGDVAANGDASFASIVIAAHNAAGYSRFVIVTTGAWCSDCTY